MERTVERRSVHDGWNEVDEQTRGSEEDVGQTSQINASQRTELLLSSDSRLGGGSDRFRNHQHEFTSPEVSSFVCNGGPSFTVRGSV